MTLILESQLKLKESKRITHIKLSVKKDKIADGLKNPNLNSGV